jgi:hypothetical protein
MENSQCEVLRVLLILSSEMQISERISKPVALEQWFWLQSFEHMKCYECVFLSENVPYF